MQVVSLSPERFQADSAGTVPVQENSNSVVRLGDNSFVACEDLGGLPAYGPNGEIAKQFGLNHPYAMEMLTKQGFETEEIGPAWLGIPKDLWPWGSDRSAAVLVYLRVTMRPDASRGWVEQGTELRYFHIDASTSALAGDGTIPDWRELSGQDARRLVDPPPAPASPGPPATPSHRFSWDFWIMSNLKTIDLTDYTCDTR